MRSQKLYVDFQLCRRSVLLTACCSRVTVIIKQTKETNVCYDTSFVMSTVLWKRLSFQKRQNSARVGFWACSFSLKEQRWTSISKIKLSLPSPLQWSSTFLAPGTSFMEDKFSMDWGGGLVLGWFNTLHLLCTIFLLLLHQFHLQTPGLRSWGLGTPGLSTLLVLPDLVLSFL